MQGTITISETAKIDISELMVNETPYIYVNVNTCELTMLLTPEAAKDLAIRLLWATAPKVGGEKAEGEQCAQS